MSEKLKSGFGENLKALRMMYGYSQAQLAKRLSMPPSSISHFENETRHPSYMNLFIIGKRMGWSIDTLMGLRDITPQKIDTLKLDGKLSRIADILNEG
jgi:transcriptional regulator with XRE-family HTH domain